ncbi:hypothetical protein G6F65_020003 [Rhizopus arrhizus]|nr:hypothetical protein G6F65_020003 [Rhizopus arrhizus]
MAIGVVDALEIVHVHVQQRGVAVVPARAGAHPLQRHLQSAAVGQARQCVFAGAALAGALGQHGGHQDAVQAMRGDAHADQIERDLDEDDGRDVFAREQGAQAHWAQAQEDHGADQPGRAVVAKADAARHRAAGHARQGGGQPIPIEEGDEYAVAHAERPQQRQHHIQVGGRTPAIPATATAGMLVRGGGR